MTRVTYAATRAALERGETSCEEVTALFLQSLRQNAHLNAFTFVDSDGALAAARQQDEAIRAGKMRPLSGMVLAVKDLLCVRGWPVTCASRMLAGFTSLYDATAVARLKAQGAIIIGKTNCDEFGMGSTSETSWFGPVLNPVADGYVPGGSSSGSAAAVAAGLCHAALGTDTGGSIRQPAALTGIVGLKPTYGRVSRYGLVAYASSFDCVGPMAHTADDAALILSTMAGADPRDATSAPVTMGVTRDAELGSLRIGVPQEYFGAGLCGDIRRAIKDLLQELRAAGAATQPVVMPHTPYGVATYYILATAEASSNLSRYDGLRYGFRPKGSLDLAETYTRARSLGFGREVKRRIMLGTHVLSSGYYDAYYAKAQRVRALVRRDFDRAFAEVDVLVAPATPAAGIRQGSFMNDPLQMYLSDIYTVTANLAGIPGLTVPIGTSGSGLPIGVQLLGRPFEEGRLLQFGAQAMRLARERK